MENTYFQLYEKMHKVPGINQNFFQDAFAYLIPRPCTIQILRAYLPIIEIGAGKAYWAHLAVRQTTQHKDYDCYDFKPKPNTFYPVKGGTGEVVANYNTDWNLFVCSPDYETDQLSESLENFKGRFFIFAGDKERLDKYTLDLIDEKFNLWREMPLPKFNIKKDDFFRVYKRLDFDVNTTFDPIH